ncbi:hypothetical protein D9619_011562 [Psilocybe cf. subviscida]|uniref:NACHT domain-containing protein n=1 Tax=Psilocybe cf. subviscida TaxID=2480587 RepID=A0A8H5BUJ4_9AGAR|nr:hypothetical protein D9619_011562 [Psilocybe cf. subviscida]
MAPSQSSPDTQAGAASDSSRKGSNLWSRIKPSLVFGLKATEKALDGLPIPGAKGCIGVVLHFLETADLAAENIEVLRALQLQYEVLQSVLLPVYVNKALGVPDDLRKDVGELSRKLDELAAEWEPQLEREPKRRRLLHGLTKASDDRGVLTRFAKAVDQTIQTFLIVTSANARLEAHRAVIKDREDKLLDRLPRARIASYKSIRTGRANGCLEGTRISILETIRRWATDPDHNQPPMFWLNGLAGIGKTTIAHTIAFELDKKGFLGASFVFLRADDQLKDARLVFPTLAFQLAQFNSQFKTRLAEVLEHDPDCGSNLLDLQFEKLILQPLSAISRSEHIIVILDALDECEPEELTSQLLRTLVENIKSVPFLRVFITSRPEGYIREALDLVDSGSPHQKLVLHEDVYAEEVQNDIRLFLKKRLQEIWDKRMKQTSVCWPSEGDLENLVKQSGKLFVYAATAVRFVGGSPTLNLNRQLTTLLGVKIGHVPVGEPYRQLDGLYLQILESVFAESSDVYYIQRFRRIVGSIVLLERPLPLGSLAKFLGEYSVEDIAETLYHLHSIIIVPTVDSGAPRTYHLSFPNFITNSSRCTNPKPYIDPAKQAQYLFLRCLAIMEKDFGPITADALAEGVERSATTPLQNLNAPSPAVPRADEHDVASPAAPRTDELDVIDERSDLSHTSVEDQYDSEDPSLAPEIRYSDNYWCRHLMNIPPVNREAARRLEQFIGRYLLKWLQRRTSRIMHDIMWPNVRLAEDTFDIIHDVYRWGFHSGCSNQFQAFLRQSAKDLYAQLFPDARVSYSFGRRLNPVPATVYNHPSPETINSLSPAATESALSFDSFAPVGPRTDPFANVAATNASAQNVNSMMEGFFQPELPFDDHIVQNLQSLTDPNGSDWMSQFQQNFGLDMSQGTVYDQNMDFNNNFNAPPNGTGGP